MKIYFPLSHYNAAFRGHVFPLLKPFIKAEGFTDAERMTVYNISEKDISIVTTIAAADVVILPMSWNYYVLQEQLDSAIALIEVAEKEKKIVWSVNVDDVGVLVPYYKHVKVFRMSGFSSQLPNTHTGLPVFINDPLAIHYNAKPVPIPTYQTAPIVAFCGYAEHQFLPLFKQEVKAKVKQLLSYVKTSVYDPNPVFIAPKFRSHCLDILENDRRIKTRFIRRAQYRAGAQSAAERLQSTIAFFDNIAHAQYVLCVRGAGNFSVRLYETLAMGRIPVYIHTDGFLPLPDLIDWKQHVVWVDAKHLDRLPDAIMAFHKQFDAQEFKALCDSNRLLWETSLRLKGFFDEQYLSHKRLKVK